MWELGFFFFLQIAFLALELPPKTLQKLSKNQKMESRKNRKLFYAQNNLLAIFPVFLINLFSLLTFREFGYVWLGNIFIW